MLQFSARREGRRAVKPHSVEEREGKEKEGKGEGVLEGYLYFTISEEDDSRIRYPRRAYNTKEFACWPDI